jgi:hypothetical protein
MAGKSPNLSTAHLIADFINTIGHKRTWRGRSGMSALPPPNETASQPSSS